MSSTPRVSVILPSYNRGALLSRAIATVLTQSYRDFELLVIDDASDDDSAARLAAIDDPRLRVLRQPQRGGAARARNAGLRAARGELIAFQDSDDEWLVWKLEQQVALLDASPAEVGWIGGTYLVEGGGRVYSVRSPSLIAGDGYEGELLIGEPFVTPTWLVRRAVIEAAGGFDESMPCLEDWDLIFKLAGRCRFRAVEDHVLMRHGSADGLYAHVGKRIAGLTVMLERHRPRWLMQPDQYARWCAELSRLQAQSGQLDAARRWLDEAAAHESTRSPRIAALRSAATIHPRLFARLSRSRLSAPFGKRSGQAA